MNVRQQSRALRPVDGGLPWNAEAEQAVLGSILINQRIIQRLVGLLRPEDLYLPVNAEIYAAMLELAAADTPPDVIMVSEHLQQRNRLDEAGGVAYLASLAQITPTSLNAEHYARIVVNHAIRRRLIDAGERITSIGLADSLSTDEALLEAAATVQGVRTVVRSHAWEDKTLSVDRLHSRLIGPIEEDERGMMTGLGALDRIMGGMRRGDLIICGARPSLGKTSLATTIAHHTAVHLGQAVLFFSLEMRRDAIWEKLLSLQTRIPWALLTSHDLNDSTKWELEESVQKLKSAPIDVVPAREWTVQAIRQAASEVHQRMPLSLVVVDYVGLIRSEKEQENRVRELSEITASLKGMALELECTVLALSQLNREPEHQPRRDPRMSELRESGSLEQDSDVVLLLSYPNGQRQDPRPPVEQIATQVAKNRMGQTGKTLLGFRGSHMQFVDLEWPEPSTNPVKRFFTKHDHDDVEEF